MMRHEKEKGWLQLFSEHWCNNFCPQFYQWVRGLGTEREEMQLSLMVGQHWLRRANMSRNLHDKPCTRNEWIIIHPRPH